jgi:hypothetical protein
MILCTAELRCFARAFDRQKDRHTRALALLALDVEPASVSPDELIDQMQSHPGARNGADIAGAIVALPDPADLVRRDTQAAVFDRDLHKAIMRARAEGHRTLFRRVFEGVRDEIAEDLVEKLRVPCHLARELPDVRLQPSPDADLRVVAGEALEHVLQIERAHSRPQISMRELHRVRQACNKAGHPEHACANLLGPIGDVRRLRPLSRGDQTLGMAIDDHQGRAELVRDHANEIALLGRDRALLVQRADEDLRLARKALAGLEKLDRVAAENGKRSRHLADFVSPSLEPYGETCVLRRQPPHQACEFEQRT